MSLDLQELNEVVKERATTDVLGAALRAKLGDPEASIIDAEDLNRDAQPPLPMIALRRGPAPKTERIIRLPLYTWYAFDEPGMGNWRIDELLTLLAALYDPACGAPLLRLSRGLIADLDTDISPHYDDPALGLPASWIRLAITASA